MLSAVGSVPIYIREGADRPHRQGERRDPTRHSEDGDEGTLTNGCRRRNQ